MEGGGEREVEREVGVMWLSSKRRKKGGRTGHRDGWVESRERTSGNLRCVL